MTGSSRFVVLGLAMARSPWFSTVAQWSNSASVPVEFVKCMSPLELRAHLASGRPYSALLVDGGVPGLDRDLVDEARGRGCAVVVVDGVHDTSDWIAIGASGVINPLFGRDDLVDALTRLTLPIGRGDAAPGAAMEPPQPRPAGDVEHLAQVAVVCGPGGTGASTASIALAQGLRDGPHDDGMVLLADLALHAEQAMLHDARDVVPGIQDLVEAHRTSAPPLQDLRGYTFDIEARGYQLLLGLRRPRHWATLRPRALTASLHSLRSAWRTVVCDIDADLEGEAEGGSIDVEARHLMARTATSAADVAFAVGHPTMKGLHGLVRVIGELLDHGVPAARIVPVVNLAPKAGRPRADVARAVATLLQGRPDARALPTPVFLPERGVDQALRDGVRFPAALAAPLASAFHAVIAREGGRHDIAGPSPIAPGSLGHWAAARAEPA